VPRNDKTMATQILHYGRPLTARKAGVRALWWREYAKPHQTFRVVTRDGVEIRGVHLQNDFDTLLIYCHGFSSCKNTLHIPRLAESFADEMDVIVFDFRGHGESGGATTFGDKELLDLDAVMQYAKRFGYARVVLMGSSMGGAIAIRYAADAAEVNAVITLGAFAHKQFSAASMMGLALLKWSVSRAVVRYATPTRIERATPPYNPCEYVARISPRPFLIIHGERDPLIPLSHARELFANAREPKTLLWIPRGGHVLEKMNAQTRAYILEWMAREVGAQKNRA